LLRLRLVEEQGVVKCGKSKGLGARKNGRADSTKILLSQNTTVLQRTEPFYSLWSELILNPKERGAVSVVGVQHRIDPPKCLR
jgi:hypothetical protein